ncbi:MAG: hypothetical protein GY789_24960 [Hyphomicrobiales bacterium]|nr:hypothetical protein [Hyphomicrobiales bacterium]MCP5000902.1 hypothetical protein [Hyphomicrobiales bacterium]
MGHAWNIETERIHRLETFRDTVELKLYLMMGTAEKYRKDIDQIAEPECHYFRGLVAWAIRPISDSRTFRPPRPL